MKCNHDRFGDDLIGALCAWSKETQNFDVRQDLVENGEDPDDIEEIYGYWLKDQLTEFIEWLFRGVGAVMPGLRKGKGAANERAQ